jgi:hypothetical protein
MSRRAKRILVAVAAVAAVGLVFLAGVYLISDEKGLPVPTTFAGGKCWLTTRGIDVLDCRELGRGFYVAGWAAGSALGGVSRSIEVCFVASCRMPSAST